jgi:hypothetical protein
MLLDEIMSLVQVNATSSFNTMTDIGPVFILLGVFAIAMGVMLSLSYVAGSLEKYRRFKRILSFFGKTLNYAAYGSLTVVIIAIPCLVGYWGLSVASENSSGSFELLKWVGIIGGGYVGLTILGYATKNKWWKRIFKYHKAEKDQKTYVETMADLPTGVK